MERTPMTGGERAHEPGSVLTSSHVLSNCPAAWQPQSTSTSVNRTTISVAERERERWAELPQAKPPTHALSTYNFRLNTFCGRAQMHLYLSSNNNMNNSNNNCGTDAFTKLKPFHFWFVGASICYFALFQHCFYDHTDREGSRQRQGVGVVVGVGRHGTLIFLDLI